MSEETLASRRVGEPQVDLGRWGGEEPGNGLGENPKQRAKKGTGF